MYPLWLTLQSMVGRPLKGAPHGQEEGAHALLADQVQREFGRNEVDHDLLEKVSEGDREKPEVFRKTSPHESHVSKSSLI